MMFALRNDFAGDAPYDAAYAQARQKWERLYEVTQLKGDGETHPLLSNEDEFADYENWDWGNLDLSEAKTPQMVPGEYARSGLLRGLQLEGTLGVNPFKFGMIGATDNHVGLSTVDDNNFFGKFPIYEPNPERAVHEARSYEQLGLGYKGWLDAAGNPREKVYDVVWPGERKPGTNGKLPAVGDTVDLSIPSWTNTIGAAELGAVWTDPDFSPDLRAYYYARVIEIPTPRWTAYDRVKFKLDLPPDIPLKTRERAYTSPIWYNPR
jgi:hypothetical protein